MRTKPLASKNRIFVEDRVIHEVAVGIRTAFCFIALPALTQFCAQLIAQPQPPMTTSQYARAEAQLSRQLKADPTNGSLWFLLGVARAQLKEVDPAIEAFQKAAALDPQKAPTWFDLGLLYMEKNESEKAEAAYAHGLALDPSNVSANQNEALLLMRREAFQEALTPLERLKQATPGDVAVRISLIEACVRAGLPDKGATELDELLSSHALTLPQGLTFGKDLAAHQQTDLAQRLFEWSATAWPDSPEAHGELGLLLLKRDKSSEAAKELRQAVQLKPDSVTYNLGLGEALNRSKQYLQAFQFLQAAQQRFPDQLRFQYELAFTDVCLQRFQDAIALLEDLARYKTDSSEVQFLLGGAYELSGELQKAEDHYRQAIHLAPQDAANYRVLASLLQEQGPERLDESIALLRKALALDPRDAQSKIVLARCLGKKGQLDEAATLLQQAVAIQPEWRRAHSALAEVYRRQHKLAEAEQEQSIAAKLEDEKITKDWDIWDPHATSP